MARLNFLSTLALFLTAFFPTASLRAESAYAISDSTTGVILEQSGGSKKLPIGSLTKIATAMVVLDWAAAKGGDLNELATVPHSATQIAAAQGVGFAPGDRSSLRDLLYAALMQSDNVAAETLADHLGRALGGGSTSGTTVDYFVAQMNALARRQGMTRTRFLNAHGLDHLERSAPYSTAEDLAKLTGYAMANSAFRFYVSQKERKISVESAAGTNSYLLRNTNELLGVSQIDGVKIGTTAKAGQCLILSSARPPESRQEGENHIITPRRLNVVLLGSTNRFAEGTALLQRGWRLYDAWAAAGRPEKGWKAPR